MSGVGTILGALDKRYTANLEANQLEQNAGQAFASAQRSFLQTQRQVAYVQSKVRSIAGGSGAGAQDVGVQNIQADIGRQGEYAALSELYQGKSEQVALMKQAAADRQAGNMALEEGAVGASGSDIGSQATTLFDRYAGQLPNFAGSD